MDMENFSGIVEIGTKGITKMIKEMDMEKCIGLMDLFTKAFGKMVFKKA